MATRKTPKLHLVSAPAKKAVLAKKPAHPRTTRVEPLSAHSQTVDAPRKKADIARSRPASARPGRAEAARKQAPASTAVRIFQIHYHPDQRPVLDPTFEPYDNEGDKSPLLEFNVFRKLMDSELVRDADLWGALSWKFQEKTGLSGEQLRQIIARNPGYDVYYCNPFPEMEALYPNLWLQGETSHPNFLILCHDFFEAAALDKEVLTQLLPSSRFAASHYLVATPRFWRGYVDFVSEVIARAERGMSSTAKAMIYSSAADAKAMHAGASYMPFIVERLFGVYLARTDGEYKAHKFVCDPQEEKMNVHLKLLRQMKDVAVSSKSLWMATCWTNYRNLYFGQTHGSAWCKAFVKSITPSRINFGK